MLSGRWLWGPGICLCCLVLLPPLHPCSDDVWWPWG